MKPLLALLHAMFAAGGLLIAGCGGGASAEPPVTAPPGVPSNPSSAAWRGTLTVSYGGVAVDAVIDKPQGTEFDALVVYHGSVGRDSLILTAANDTLGYFRSLLDDPSTLLMVSVAYPEENLLMGDNLRQAEAALLWVKNVAAQQLGVKIRHVFLGGHSQGGYLVTRLNTLHPTRGVIANAPGPLDLVYRCGLEEQGTVVPSAQCNRLRETYGTTSANPGPYAARSLRSFTSGHTSDILFVQGLGDSLIQLHSWPAFMRDIAACSDCKTTAFFEVPGGGHPALFESALARDAFRSFLQQRR